MSLQRISLCQSPHGYRDVYWCESINEPVCLHYDPGPMCSVCHGQIDLNDAEDAENAGHHFLFHISNGPHNAEHCKKLEGSRVIPVYPIHGVGE